jgi:RNA dependent RNA polymerase
MVFNTGFTITVTVNWYVPLFLHKHNANSAQRSRSCFLRQVNSDADLDERIYKLGEFLQNVISVLLYISVLILVVFELGAKRIGLLFSGAELDFRLDPTKVADIPDMISGDEVFSDGCGLMSKKLAIYVSKAKRIIFRGKRYTPCVFQIRYFFISLRSALISRLQVFGVQMRLNDSPPA